MRHGESTDDVSGHYGGWADFPLTERGRQQAAEAASRIKAANLVFDRVYSSPLKRALETAQIVFQETNSPAPTVCELWKERNNYGILTRLKKSEARETYPEETRKYETGEWVLGQERFEDAATRARAALEFVKKQGGENVLVVTHGGLLKALYSGVWKREWKQFGDCEWREETV